MKNDPTFKFLAAVILAGVIVAFASPNSTLGLDSATEHEPIGHTAAATPATE